MGKKLYGGIELDLPTRLPTDKTRVSLDRRSPITMSDKEKKVNALLSYMEKTMGKKAFNDYLQNDVIHEAPAFTISPLEPKREPEVPFKSEVYDKYLKRAEEELVSQRGIDTQPQVTINDESGKLEVDPSYYLSDEYRAKAGIMSGAVKSVHPEFMLMTSGVGMLPRGSNILSNIARASVYGGAQGAIWNVSGIGGEQDLEGLTTDALSGAVVTGLITGVGNLTRKAIESYRVQKAPSRIIKAQKKFDDWLTHPETLKRQETLSVMENHPKALKRRADASARQDYYSSGRGPRKPFRAPDWMSPEDAALFERLHVHAEREISKLAKKNMEEYRRSIVEPFVKAEDIPRMKIDVHPGSPRSDGKSVWGWYDPSTGKIYANKPVVPKLTKKELGSMVRHESSHANLKGKYPYYLRDLFEKAFPGKAHHSDYQRYLVDPKEIYSRIDELREHMKLKPGEIVTDKAIDKITKQGLKGKTTVDPEFFELLKDKGAFRDLFNTLRVIAPAAYPLLHEDDENKKD